MDSLQNQLIIARNEINNLRQQVRNLQHVHRKDVDTVLKLLEDFRCEGCKKKNDQQNINEISSDEQDCENSSLFKSIGIIRSEFPEKRAVPRQSSVGSKLRGVIELHSSTFTNPEHSLEGLEDFSHLWIIYHFHKNSSHPKAKVAPPRLGGQRVGVFSTRSPHRPCPIGLSLVEIDKVEGSLISFYGTDMVDGTPVLDIKPYIPLYDSPNIPDSGRTSVGLNDRGDFYNSRQEPDGEESDIELNVIGASAITPTNTNQVDLITSISNAVKVPNWVVASDYLEVCFNDRAQEQIDELGVQKQCIVDILEADPRSVYLRTKYGSQIFTFQLREVTVTCKFDDKAGTVTVVQVRRNENVQDEEVSGDPC